jgi:hypothetical protein
MHLSLRKVSALRIAILVSALCAGLGTVAAQNRIVVPRLGVPTFQHLTRNSGYIFSGTVKSVSMLEPDSLNSIGSIKITFHVENAVRGVRKGQMLVVREWAGLWESGEHYRVGERVALFLFRPGKLGLTSPVGGVLGRFPLDPYGRVLLNREHIAAISTDPVLAGRWQGRSRISWKEFSLGIRRELQAY